MKTYLPSELSHLFHIHPNTVRLYEKWGYISKAERKSNGYRVYTEQHFMQLKVCRQIFGYPFTNIKIRNAGNLLIEASSKWDIELAKKYALEYINSIELEIEIAQKTACTLKIWSNQEAVMGEVIPCSKKEYNRKEISGLLGITSEAVRNWERNGLIITTKVGIKGEKLFDEVDLERIRIVYMLRQAGYSISSIHRCLSMYDKGYSNLILPVLNNPENRDELLSVGDRWLYELEKLKKASKEIPFFLENMQTI